MARAFPRFLHAVVWCLVLFGLCSGVSAVLLLPAWWATRYAYQSLIPVDPELGRSRPLYPTSPVGEEDALDRGLNVVYQVALHVLAYAGVAYFVFALATVLVAFLPRRRRMAPLLSLYTAVLSVWGCQYACVWLLREELLILR